MVAAAKKEWKTGKPPAEVLIAIMQQQGVEHQEATARVLEMIQEVPSPPSASPPPPSPSPPSPPSPPYPPPPSPPPQVEHWWATLQQNDEEDVPAPATGDEGLTLASTGATSHVKIRKRVSEQPSSSPPCPCCTPYPCYDPVASPSAQLLAPLPPPLTPASCP